MKSDALDRANADQHVVSHGKNFKPLVAAGSWKISGFKYGYAKCACCGRPIRHLLQLKNDAHDAAKSTIADYNFPETINIGIVCGPKVFTESCVAFYTDPNREWDRQLKSWKGYIDYVVLCVKNEDLWARVPSELRVPVDDYLQRGGPEEHTAADHSGNWWLLRDAKKRFLKIKRPRNTLPQVYTMFMYARSMERVAQRLQLVTGTGHLNNDFNWVEDE